MNKKIDYGEYLESGNIGFIRKSPYLVEENPIKIINVTNESNKEQYSRKPYVKLWFFIFSFFITFVLFKILKLIRFLNY